MGKTACTPSGIDLTVTIALSPECPPNTATAPDRRWVSDVTSVRTVQGWLHLAIVLGLYARCIVGWAMAPLLDQALAHEALAISLAVGRPSVIWPNPACQGGLPGH